MSNPIVIQQPTENSTTLLAAFVTIAVTVGLMALTSVRQGQNLVEVVKLSATTGVQGVIGSEGISTSVEAGLSHIPESLRKAMVSIVDVFDPFTATTESNLDNQTQQWIRNVLDANPETGAVSVQEINPASQGETPRTPPA